MPTVTDADAEEVLAQAELTPLGRLVESSNRAVLVRLGEPDSGWHAIHKPIDFERPLWDYPDGTLAGRERAAYLISRAGGFGIVPPTVLREGPWGQGSLQWWVGTPGEEVDLVVDVCDPGETPPGWVEVLQAETPEGEEVSLVHAGDDDVRSVAVLDALLNNSDRKGGHLARTPQGVRGFDHGVSLGVEDKLRTVLWGWAGEPLLPADRDRVRRVKEALDGGELVSQLAGLLTMHEISALALRADRLLHTGVHPEPSPHWPAIPWPAM